MEYSLIGYRSFTLVRRSPIRRTGVLVDQSIGTLAFARYRRLVDVAVAGRPWIAHEDYLPHNLASRAFSVLSKERDESEWNGPAGRASLRRHTSAANLTSAAELPRPNRECRMMTRSVAWDSQESHVGVPKARCPTTPIDTSSYYEKDSGRGSAW